MLFAERNCSEIRLRRTVCEGAHRFYSSAGYRNEIWDSLFKNPTKRPQRQRSDAGGRRREISHERGLLEPIILHEGLILDGRNRYRACQIAGVEPRTERFNAKPPNEARRNAY